MTKQGMDDFFARGHSVDDLLDLAEPWNRRGPGITLLDERGTGDDRIDTLQSRVTQLEIKVDELKADNAAIIALVNQPHLTLADIRLALQLAILPSAKASQGDLGDEGKPILSSSEMSNDWRKKAEPGQRVALVNHDGTVPRMARGNVKPLMEKAIERGYVKAKPIPVDRSHTSDGGSVSGYRDTAWIVEPAPTIAAAVNPWLNASPAPKQRKPRALPESCPHCGEVHPRLQRTYCMNPVCGMQIGRDKIIDPDQATGDMSSPVRESPSPRPQYLLGDDISPVCPEEPDRLLDAPLPTGDTLSPDDYGADAPEFYEAQEALQFADHATPDTAKRALQDVEAQLARVAVQRGRTPVPKPRRDAAMPSGEAGDDYWSWA